jgi:catalase
MKFQPSTAAETTNRSETLVDESKITQSILDALGNGTGVRPGCRLNHARGILLEGSFQATRVASALSSTNILNGSDIKVVLRFSNSGAKSEISEGDPKANPCGVGVRLSLANENWDLVGHSVEAFPASTPEEFLLFQEAVNAGASDSDFVNTFLATHNRAKQFLESIPNAPRSFAEERYFFLHGIRLIDPLGKEKIGRITLEGISQPDRLTRQEAAEMTRDFLQAEMRNRIARGLVPMKLFFNGPNSRDDLNDISEPWLTDGNPIHLGDIRLEKILPDDQALHSSFDPGHLPPGIAFVGDPMIAVRSKVYAVASACRHRSNNEL